MPIAHDASPARYEVHYSAPRRANQFFDENRVRYKRAASRPGQNENQNEKKYNWLFLPGGPGADSQYLQSLIDLLQLPGDVWLVDFPGNGDNTENIPSDYDYDAWFSCLLPAVKRFENPIIVGHSFGGMFPLCFNEMEKLLKGLVILNSTPSLCQQEALDYAKNFELPDLTNEMGAFVQTPNQETFNAALGACMPYYFPKQSLDRGKALLADVPFTFQPAVWWQIEMVKRNFTAEWVPQKVPTLIIGGRYDCIVPFSVFQKDARFHRGNIQMVKIEEGGHMPWIEEPQKVKEEFERFCQKSLGDNQAAE